MFAELKPRPAELDVLKHDLKAINDALWDIENRTRAKEAAKSIYDLTVAESKSERFRGGDVAVANATNLAQLKDSYNEQQAGQNFALDKGGSFGVNPTGGVGGGAAPAATSAGDALALGKSSNGSLELRGAAFARNPEGIDQPQQTFGYRANSNYAQQARVVRGRAFYQNGNTWTDATASTKADLKKREVKFNSDEYFKLLADHPEASAWLALGNEVDVVLDDALVMVR